jgi:ubiquinone/menaquinone biosynthesis C-methylase UbiE
VSLWGRVFAAGYEHFLAPSERAGLADRRREVLADARGRVLEVGPGPGMNLPHYPRARIDELVLAEPEEPMARRLERRVAEQGLTARVVRAPAEALPFEEDSFDTIVCTFVLCTVPDPQAALTELRRVLRSGGSLLLIEHVRSEEPRLARWQDRLQAPWRWFAHGCHCNRSTAATLEHSAFAIDHLEPGEVPKASPLVRPMISGRVVAPSRPA